MVQALNFKYILFCNILQEGGMDPPAAKAPRGRPLITTRNIKSVADLLPFFNAVCPTDQPAVQDNANQANGITMSTSKDTGSPKQGVEDEDASFANCSINEYIERIVERDFLVPLSKI